MKGYVVLFLLPLPKKNLAEYKKLARRFGRVAVDHGALHYREFIGEDLKPKYAPPFTNVLPLKARRGGHHLGLGVQIAQAPRQNDARDAPRPAHGEDDERKTALRHEEDVLGRLRDDCRSEGEVAGMHWLSDIVRHR
ncbi:MAG: DUF1428 family protein [bacterium]|nr:DUF1428 family protein [bacterium]